MKKIIIITSLFVLCFSYANSQISIDIEPNKTSDVAPFKLYVDASETEDLAITNSLGEEWNFHNLHFEWDFGDDPDAVWPNSGKSKNTGYGPISGHVYDLPGVYTVKLTVSNPLTGEEASESFELTVTDPDVVFSGENTICFSTSGDFSEAPEGALHVTTSNFKEVFDTYAKSGKRLLFRRGETWSSSATPGRISEDGPSIIGAFGTGEKPLLTPLEGATNVIRLSTLTYNTTSNWRIMDLEIDGSQNPAASAVSFGGQDNLLYRVDMHLVNGGVSFGTSGLDYWMLEKGYSPVLSSDLGIVECSINDIGNPFVNGGGVGIFGGCEKLLILGNELIDNRDGEHNIRLVFHIKAVLSHNYVAKPAYTKQAMTLRSEDYQDETGVLKGKGSSRKTIVSDNHFYADSTTIMLNSGYGNNGTDSVKGFDFIFERNFVESEGTVSGPLSVASFRNSIRNNVFISGGSAAISISKMTSNYPEKMDAKIYNNSFYSNKDGYIIALGLNIPQEGCEIYNNFFAGNPDDTQERIRVNAETLDAIVSDNVESLDPGTVSGTYEEASDFELLSTSILINQGREVPNPMDYFGNKRDISNIDIGAFECMDVDNTDVEDITDVEGFAVYPIPVKESLHISNLRKSQSTITVYNMSGQLISEKNLNGSEADISTTGWNTGVYLLFIEGKAYKVIKE